MIDLRKLAAIDIAFLGPKFVFVEYVVGVFFSVGLACFVLFRSSSFWQMALGTYFICLGINYVPMLGWAIAISSRQNAQMELGSELADKRHAMTKYRRQSLVLLIPLLPVALMIARKRSR